MAIIKEKYLKSIQYRIMQCRHKNILTIGASKLVINFSFDDFPISAVINGTEILNNRVKGTVYVSLSKMNLVTCTKPHFALEKINLS